jgi:hypothetical protein
MSASEAALGFRAGRGGGIVVGVAIDAGEPRVVLSTFLATAAAGDRLALEPYHLAVEMVRDGSGGAAESRPPRSSVAGLISQDVEAAVAEGRRRQDALASENLAAVLTQLRASGYKPRLAALLINRAGWLTEEHRLAHSLSAPEHPPVIEGLAVRDALRFAFASCALPATEMDEKSLPETASAVLGRSLGELEGRLKALGAAAGKPWRKEQKAACLAAWLALATP